MSSIYSNQLQTSDVRGFTLLEAIVALVLLSTAGLVLFSWINASFDGLARIEQSNARAAAELNAMEFMKTVNPMQQPEGQTQLGEVQLKWRAKPITELVPNRTDNRDPGPFTVALYETEVSLDGRPNMQPYTITLRQMGYLRSMADLEELPNVGSPSGAGKTVK
ncbi:MAG: type II secretion system protein [Rhodocyclaceae bacterium]|jgi:general secretion pathway protein I|nr:type II secretion system protein [Rhodocyclaceae bacterium]MCA3167514.1 type II secretion system protein [Burkholderiales bacterium]MCE2724610.1 type II secretion system GspH family protein [Betaproteobacteria bacterium]MCA3026124.1 type II secretion system protein [Rhodocyclaceae bacterium]MCA3030196.1 type II secretion system protein [Rhodocyclaceae bacterium]